MWVSVLPWSKHLSAQNYKLKLGTISSDQLNNTPKLGQSLGEHQKKIFFNDFLPEGRRNLMIVVSCRVKVDKVNMI